MGLNLPIHVNLKFVEWNGSVRSSGNPQKPSRADDFKLFACAYNSTRRSSAWPQSSATPRERASTMRTDTAKDKFASPCLPRLAIVKIGRLYHAGLPAVCR